MADARRLAELSMPTELARETAAQINTAMATKAAIAALTTIATADATDPATTMALSNINKAKINQIIAALKA